MNRLYVYASQEAYSVRKSVKFYTIYVNLMKFLSTAPEKIVFLYWKGTADECDDKFTSGCNSIVCLNLRLNVRLNLRLNVRRTSQWLNETQLIKKHPRRPYSYPGVVISTDIRCNCQIDLAWSQHHGISHHIHISISQWQHGFLIHKIV